MRGESGKNIEEGAGEELDVVWACNGKGTMWEKEWWLWTYRGRGRGTDQRWMDTIKEDVKAKCVRWEQPPDRAAWSRLVQYIDPTWSGIRCGRWRRSRTHTGRPDGLNADFTTPLVECWDFCIIYNMPYNFKKLFVCIILIHLPAHRPLEASGCN